MILQYNKEEITYQTLSVKTGYFNQRTRNEGLYEIRLLSKKKQILYSQKFDFPLIYHNYADPSWFNENGKQIYFPKSEEAGPFTIDKTSTELVLPYKKKATLISIYKDDKRLLDIPIVNLQSCGDKKCTSQEKKQCVADCGSLLIPK